MKKFLTNLLPKESVIFAICLFPLSIFIYGCASTQATRENLLDKFARDQSLDSLAFIQARSQNIQAIDTQVTNTQSANYVIRQGDQIVITVIGYSEFDTTVTVGETGTVSIQLIGDIMAEGLTKAQFTGLLSSKLGQYIRTKFDIIVKIINRSVQNIVILGEVSRPGNYPITNNLSLLQIIAIAGGTLLDADIEHVKIIRGGNTAEIVEVDLNQYFEGRKSAEVPLIKTGDTVFVPRQENIVREIAVFFRDAIFLFSFFALAQ